MSNAEKKSYIDAVLCLAKKDPISGLPGATNRFEDHLAIHNNQTPEIHWVVCIDLARTDFPQIMIMLTNPRANSFCGIAILLPHMRRL